MLKKFTKGTFIYAGSAVIFSISRQLIFFPIVQKFCPTYFARISFLLVTIDFLIYVFGSTLADYYVRAVTKGNNQKGLYKFLFRLTLMSILTSIVFFFQEFTILQSFLLGLYMVLFAVNTLQLKVYFNNLIFIKNYGYVLLRLIPYALLLLIVLLFDLDNIKVFILLLLLFETIAAFHLYIGNIRLGFDLDNIKEKTDFSVLNFFIIYISFALVQRIDMFYVEYFFSETYVEYYQIISIFLIGVNPIILLTSSSLLSMLTIVDFNSFLKVKSKICIGIVLVALIVGSLFLIMSPYLIEILYPKNKLLSRIPWAPFIVVFFSILFFVSKTFLIKYVNLNRILILNILVVVFPLIFLKNFNYFLIIFFLMRGIGYLAFLLGLKNERHVGRIN